MDTTLVEHNIATVMEFIYSIIIRSLFAALFFVLGCLDLFPVVFDKVTKTITNTWVSC